LSEVVYELQSLMTKGRCWQRPSDGPTELPWALRLASFQGAVKQRLVLQEAS